MGLLHSASSAGTEPHAGRSSSSRTFLAAVSCRAIRHLPHICFKVFAGLGFVASPASPPVAILADSLSLDHGPLRLGVLTLDSRLLAFTTSLWNALLAPPAFIWLAPLFCSKFVCVATVLTSAARLAARTLQANPALQNSIPLGSCGIGLWLLSLALTAPAQASISPAITAFELI